MNKKLPQKLISFLDTPSDLQRIADDMKKGWSIISLIQNGNYYLGIMEKMENNEQSDSSEEKQIFLPPRKKINITF